MKGWDPWTEVLTELWDDILREARYKWLRRILGLILLVGSVWMAHTFLELIKAPESIPTDTTSARVEMMAEARKVKGEAESFDVLATARYRGAQISQMANLSGRLPFKEPVEMPVLAALPITPSSQLSSGGALLPLMTGPVLPQITVRAVLNSGKSSTAVLDIDGVGEGIIVWPGYVFSGGLGRVRSISEKQIVILWGGKRISLPVNA